MKIAVLNEQGNPRQVTIQEVVERLNHRLTVLQEPINLVGCKPNTPLGVTDMRALKRHRQRCYTLRQRRCLAARTKGLWTHDDPECITCVYKRNDREQTGRLRLLKGCVGGAARRLRADKE